MSEKKIILHCDLDSFFASVEQALRPELEGRPVAVSAARGQNIITAASYEAKRYGVKVGVPLVEARRICPGLQFVFARMDAYQRAGAHVHEIIRKLGAPIETLGIDECFLDTGLVDDSVITGGALIEGDRYERAIIIGNWIKEKVKSTTGMNITVGGGSNKTVAKLISDSTKPDGLRIMRAEDELAFLHGTPLRNINGIGPKTYGKLAGIGLNTVGEAASYSKARLVTILGKRQGHIVYEITRNNFDEGVWANPKPRTTSSTQSFGSKGCNAQEVLEDLLVEALGRIERSGRSVRFVIVFAADEKNGYQGKKDLRSPTRDRKELAAVARAMIREIPGNFRANIAGVTFDGLSDAEQLKLDLYLPWMRDAELSAPVSETVYDAAEQLKRALYRGMRVTHPVFGKGEVEQAGEYEVTIRFADKSRNLEFWSPLQY